MAFARKLAVGLALILSLALPLAGASSASAEDPPKGLSTFGVSGKVGTYPVGMQLTVRDHRQFVSGHYFYAKTLTDIPLTGGVDGETLTLKEPGGGTFRLHLVSNDSARGQTLTFYNSTGLAGTWTQNAKTLPVTLGFSTAYDGGPRERHYGEITEQSDAVFEARAGQFLRAATRGDRAAAADAVSYPLRVNGAPAKTIRNKAELLAQWNSVFSPALVAALREAVPHEMFVRQGMAMVGDGVVWFDDKGAKVINPR
jgi:hypothetical protein